MREGVVQYGLGCFQESRDGRDGHGGVEEHDLVAPAPDRRGVPRAGHAAAADPAHRAAAQARQAGLKRRPVPKTPPGAAGPKPRPLRWPGTAPAEPRRMCSYH